MTYLSTLVKLLAVSTIAVSTVSLTPSVEATGVGEEPALVAAISTPPSHEPAPGSTVHPSAQGPHGTCAQYESLIGKYDWSTTTAMQICSDESQGNPTNKGDVDTAFISCGLMQIRTLPGRPSCTRLEDPEFNMAYAYSLWKAGEKSSRGTGFCPWTTYKDPLGYCQR